MENNFKYIVYQTINLVNNKIYVGYHKVKDPNIFCGYIGNGVNIYYPSTYMNPKYPFLYAVKKYGTSNFRRSTLYIFETEQEALEKEAEIVNEEFISRKDTYNVALGGLKRPYIPSYSKIYKFNLDGTLVKEYQDIYEASEDLLTWKNSIYAAILHKLLLYEHYWSYLNSIDINTYSKPNKKQKVYKYDSNGKCVEVFESLGEAARAENVQPATIILRIKAGSFSAGFYYSYNLYDLYIKKPRLDLKGKSIYLYNLSGNFVKEVQTEELKKEYNIHSYKEISDVILNKSSLRGFLLRCEKFDKIEFYSPKNKKRAVVVYTKEGDFVKEFDSVTAACKELNLDSSSVSKILRGCAKSTKGYTLKYKIKDIV